VANDRPKSEVSKRETTRPFTFFFLVLPYGISSGFVSITLPFVLIRRSDPESEALFLD